MNLTALFLILAILFNASANILMKHGVKTAPVAIDAGVSSFVLSYLSNWQLLAGIVSFGIALVFYSKTLEKMQLSLAYPAMTSSGIVIVSLWSLLVLGERLTPVQYTGILLIIGGIWLINLH